MFGLIYVLANLVGITISGTKEILDNECYKEQGWDDYKNGNGYGTHTYYDAQGRQRDLITNHIMSTYRNEGDLYIKDLKTGQIKNLSEEKRKKDMKIIRETNPKIKAIFYKYWNSQNSELKDGDRTITGKVYRDVNNDQLYFERYITWRKDDFSKAGVRGDFCAAWFYLRISDGKIVSISDEQKKYDEKNNKEEKYDEFITFFNSEQEKGGFVVRNRNKFAEGKYHFYIGSEDICNNK